MLSAIKHVAKKPEYLQKACNLNMSGNHLLEDNSNSHVWFGSDSDHLCYQPQLHLSQWLQ